MMVSLPPLCFVLLLVCSQHLLWAQQAVPIATPSAAAPQTLSRGTSAAAGQAVPAQPAPAQPGQSNSPKAAGNGSPVAPDSPATYTIQRTARLVILDLVVTDAKGHQVTDLKREEFHVQEAGEGQNILNFDPAGAHTPEPSIDIESTADLDRLAPQAPVNIILLDEFNTRFEDMAFARYSLKKYLEKQPGKLPEPTMLIAVDLQHFTVLRDYTQNKDEILSALDHHLPYCRGSCARLPGSASGMPPPLLRYGAWRRL